MNNSNFTTSGKIDEYSVRYYPVIHSRLKVLDRPEVLSSPIALYFHIPFCVKQCYYCTFPIVSGKKVTESLVSDYLKALKKECSYYSKYINNNVLIETIQIGGGTPTFLSASQLEDLLVFIFNEFNCSSLKEVIIEGFPSSITKDKLNILRQVPKIKINIGIQTFNEKIIKVVGRAHTIADSFKAIDLIQQNNIPSVGIDLICGLPQSTVSDLIYDIEKIKNLGADHLTLYPLWVYEKTPLYSLIRGHKINKITSNLLEEQFLEGQKLLESVGYKRYTAFHYSSGEQHKHQYGLWQMNSKEWVGFGMGSMSYIGNKIFFNEISIQRYIEKVNSNCINIGICENMDQLEHCKFSFLYGLRMIEFSLDLFYQKHNLNFFKIFANELKILEKENLLEIFSKSIKLTPKGILSLSHVENYINNSVNSLK